MSIFEKASRLKIRFETSKGDLSVEDLWDLPLNHSKAPNLDDIAIDLYSKLKAVDVPSFVTKAPKSEDIEEMQLRFDLVKHIISVRQQDMLLAENAKKNADKKQQILALIQKKENENLENLSKEELEEMARSL